MKRICACVLLALSTLTTYAWGPMGHDVVAAIAEQNLTRKAKKNIEKLLDGHSIVFYSSWMDNIQNSPSWKGGYDKTKTWHYANVDKGLTYQTMQKNENGDVVSALTELTKQLTENYDNLTDSIRVDYVKMIVHMMGDMHCPKHIRYPEDQTIGYYKVKWRGRSVRYHDVWDGVFFEELHPWGLVDCAEMLDDCNKSEIKAITAGNVYDWGVDIAKRARCVNEFKEGDVVDIHAFRNKYRNLAETAVRDAGYRLAAVFNEIFK